uniref:Uncharacterized protein n=1 Tax=Glossina palpalis gambiensis TaxID=67801 RepID=A0A1B0BHD7_9MUSC
MWIAENEANYRKEVAPIITLLLWNLLKTNQSHSSLIDAPNLTLRSNFNNREPHSNKKLTDRHPSPTATRDLCEDEKAEPKTIEIKDNNNSSDEEETKATTTKS